MLKGKVKQIVKEIEQKRSKGDIVNLRSHLENSYEATPEKLYKELNINPMKTTVSQLMSLDEDTKWLFPEIVRDAIAVGLGFIPFISDIIMKEENIRSKSMSMPYLDFSGMKTTKGKKLTPGSTIQEDTIKVGEKIVTTHKFGKGIKVPYESVKYASLNLLSSFFTGVGSRLQRDLNAAAVDVLINGDNGKDEDGNSVNSSAAEIGVENTSNKVAFKDYLRATIRLSKIGRPATSLLGDEAQTLEVMQWDEFKKRYTGQADTKLTMKTPAPVSVDGFVSDDVSSDKLLVLSKQFAMIQITSQGLMVESDKIIARQLHEAVASIITTFGIVNRNARVLIDGGTAFTAKGFPVWMNY